jgi:acyl-CoA synthetase (NDP forming)
VPPGVFAEEKSLYIDYKAIANLFFQAAAEGRRFLYEHEVYALLRNSGAETPPRCRLILKGARPADIELTGMPGKKIVLKVVSAAIVHKSEVGGVRVVDNTPEKIRSTRRRMMEEVPVKFADWIDRHPELTPEAYRGLTGKALRAAIIRDIKGVLLETRGFYRQRPGINLIHKMVAISPQQE